MSTDVLVVGGGIAGLTTALAAAERGLRVLVLDTARPGAASRTAAGMLAPSLEGLPGAVREVAIAARDAYPTFLAGLRERTGVDVPLDRNGIIELAESSQDLDVFARRAGPGAEVLDHASLARLEPAFAAHPGAVLHPHDGSVHNVELMRALDLAVERTPGVSRRAASVVAIDLSREGPVALTADGGRIEAASLLLAAGVWMNEVAGLPRPFPVRPVRGQLLTLDRRVVLHVTYGGGGYLVPRGNTLLIGATSEDAGLEVATTALAADALRAIAARAATALRGARVVEHWAGLRPMSPDSMPVLGADPADTRVVYAGGFSRNGILFAPWAASQLAALLAGERPAAALDLFSIARFALP
ncbi:MAG: FAD-dependent oxidoreductase [Gemmatimonadaceae bacterium]